ELRRSLDGRKLRTTARIAKDEVEDVQNLNEPYGGRLVDLIVGDDERSELILKSKHLPSIQLSPRSLCDIELLATGAFSPLDHFMGYDDYQHVLKEMRLAAGKLFPIPITLPVAEESDIRPGQEIALRSARNELIAIMTVEESFAWDPLVEAQVVFRTTDVRHPLVAEMNTWGNHYISGPIKVVELPKHYDF